MELIGVPLERCTSEEHTVDRIWRVRSEHLLVLETIALMMWLLCIHGTLIKAQPAESGNAVKRKPLHPRYATCEYDSVKTDASGNVISTLHSSTRCYEEILGNGVILKMLEIPEGTFLMGSAASEFGRNADEGPQHEVRVPRFFLGQFEVTERQYEAMRTRPRVKRNLHESLSSVLGKTLPDTAADGISWTDAMEFCARLRAISGKDYRLPSEAEWEYAGRAGTTTAFEFGPVFAPALVNNLGSTPKKQGEKGTKPLTVGTSGPANAFGLFDMEGNVSEWTLDVYHPSYIGAPEDGSAWLSAKEKGTKHARVMRGGSYGMQVELLRLAAREHWDVGMSPSGFGFRVALCADSQAK